MAQNTSTIIPDRVHTTFEKSKPPDSDFFKEIVQWEVEKNGTKRTLPFFYLDGLSLNAIYTASTREVRKLIPLPHLHPMEFIPGRCLVIFSAWEFRETAGEPFDEVVIQFLVTYPKRQVFLIPLLKAMASGIFRSFIWKLPVSSEYSRAGGVDLFGAPKYLATIQFQKDPNWVHCTLIEDGCEVLRIKGKVLPTHRGKQLRGISHWSGYGGQLMSNAIINPLEFTQTRDRTAFELWIGQSHPLCQSLRNLQLSKQALIYQYTPRYEQILFPARNLCDE